MGNIQSQIDNITHKRDICIISNQKVEVRHPLNLSSHNLIEAELEVTCNENAVTTNAQGEKAMKSTDGTKPTSMNTGTKQKCDSNAY